MNVDAYGEKPKERNSKRIDINKGIDKEWMDDINKERSTNESKLIV